MIDTEDYQLIGLHHLECQVGYWDAQLLELNIEQPVNSTFLINLNDVESFGERVHNSDKDGTIIVEMKSGSSHNVQMSLEEFKNVYTKALFI